MENAVIFGHKNWTRYEPGNSFIVITSPHGGKLKPEELPNRRGKVCLEGDFRSEELAIDLRNEILLRSDEKMKPHLISCLLDRTKVDQNRPIDVACQGHEESEIAYKDYHGFIESALEAAQSKHTHALLIDMHGNSQRKKLVMLGYCTLNSELETKDIKLENSTLCALCDHPSLSASELISGHHSFGHFLTSAWGAQQQQDEDLGSLDVLPSPRMPFLPSSANYKYFYDGYTVEHWRGPKTVAIQIECSPDLRHQGPRQQAIIRSIASAIFDFIDVMKS